MSELQLLNALGIETSQTEVLFVTNQAQIPAAIIGLLQEKEYTWQSLTIAKFIETTDDIGVIGTIVIDTTEIRDDERNKICKILQHFEEKNVAAILLNNHIDFPFEKFDFASVPESVTPEEIWGRIESNVLFFKALKNRQHNKTSNHNEIHLADDTAEQLEMAGRVQRDFLPKTLPNSDRLQWATVFQPADWVSGDFYDVARLDEQHIGFYIADAVGHSVPAALLTMFLKQAITMRQTVGNDYKIFVPADVITTLNKRLTEQKLSRCLFATGCYCLLNTKTLQLTYSRAGHPYPILIRDGKMTQLQSQGGLLGVFEDAQYSQETIQLQSGDKLFLYSDGAEPLIGKCDDYSNFIFSRNFNMIKDLPVEEMLTQFESLAKDLDVPSAEIDDITALALEIK
jgi:serine phosphatase RsbU (regulator of sigma subunit)